MDYINPPEKLPQNINHKTFYSQLFKHELGYNIYLPSGYEDSGERYSVAYHLHRWTGNESSEIWPREKVYKDRQVITVFTNNSPVIQQSGCMNGMDLSTPRMLRLKKSQW